MCLPRDCETIDTAHLFGPRNVVQQPAFEKDVSSSLKKAFEEVSSQVNTTASTDLISLKDTPNPNADKVRFAILDCTDTPIQASVHPIDDGRIFRADKTFLLVGLTGELGQSLCKWMVEQGARSIVLTSRRPNVSEHFLNSFTETGATVKALPM